MHPSMERTLPSHPPRIYGKFLPAAVPLLSLMDPEPVKLCNKDLRKKLKQGNLVRLVKSINNCNRQAATIGLFPHALRKRAVEAGAEIDDLSRSVIRTCTMRYQ